MTPAEFKSWFDGFTEGLAGLPNDAQWGRIKARVAEIDGRATNYPVYVDRYVRPWYPNWEPYWYTTNDMNLASSTRLDCSTAGISSDTVKAYFSGEQRSPTEFDPAIAFHALGKADAASITTAR